MPAAFCFGIYLTVEDGALSLDNQFHSSIGLFLHSSSNYPQRMLRMLHGDSGIVIAKQ